MLRAVRRIARALPALFGLLAPAMLAAQAGPTGRIAGRVVDGESGRPVAGAQVLIVGQPDHLEADLDGRFRSAPLPVGTYSVRSFYIGYAPAQVDSVRVAAGQATVVSLSLSTTPVQLAELEVKAAEPAKISSAAGLLAEQQNAPAVSDGVSAETISKTPDSDAGQAVSRVTGVSVLDDKVVIRGLGERYSNTVLNGAEIASPEPDKKVVPLDIFPSSLLEALVASKTATPDRPGDFAGGSVDIRTKEFPDNFVFSIGTSLAYNSLATFKSFPKGPRHGTDWYGRDDGLRAQPAINPNPDRFAESFQNVWTPDAIKASPNVGFDFSVGGQQGLGGDALGIVVSGTYDAGRKYNPERYEAVARCACTFRDAEYDVSLGGILNLSYRLGSSTKFGFKNFYTRGSEDLAVTGAGLLSDPNGAPGLSYQMRYLQRYVLQSQVSGEHRLPGLLNSRVEWRGTYGRAARDDLDNRQIQYINEGDGFTLDVKVPNYRTFARLNDKTYAGQVDWSFPIAFREPADGVLKVGALYNAKDRDFGGATYGISLGGDPSVWRLPPEELFAPENVGSGGITFDLGGTLVPYDAQERVRAAYGMLDFEPLRDLRLVGGVRVERWTAAIDATSSLSGIDSVLKRNTDALWSANLTWRLSSGANLRAAAYRTIAKPDLREIAPGGYTPLLGGRLRVGNPALSRTKVMNADLRLELYPGVGELLAISGYYKRFTDPIVTTIALQGEFVELPDNAASATTKGLELEARKSLGFLSHVLANFQAGINLSLINSRVTLPERIGVFDPDLTFQGQSPYLINTSLLYQTDRLSASVLYNRVGDRITAYGGTSGGTQGPNSLELAHGSVDAKVKYSAWGGMTFTVSGRNLTNPPVEVRDDKVAGGNLTTILQRRSRTGYTISFGVDYGF
jgi:Carboxypeptidase regulatory-like domain/TonB-dependent Receptor Plug Domain